MIQIVKKACCGRNIAACNEPMCHTNEDWKQYIEECIHRGDIVEMIVESYPLTFESQCKCGTNLFFVKNNNVEK